MAKSYRFALQKVMDLRADEALHALQALQKEEAKLLALQQAKICVQQSIQDAYNSFESAQGYDYGLHFPLYIQEQRLYEAKLLQEVSAQEQCCSTAKTTYIEAKIKEKSLEKLKTKQTRVWQAQIDSQDARDMDEMGLRQFRQSV